MRQFGLIGKTLKHSFSKKYFSEKYQKEGISDANYELFELKSIQEFPQLVKSHMDLVGLNVTIPYKLEVMDFLDELDEHAQAIQAVNTIKVLSNGQLKGYNTDYFGFKDSLTDGWQLDQVSALVLGTGGASKAVEKALFDLGIPYQMVSRQRSDDRLSYDQLTDKLVKENKLIINTTPLGTFPDVDQKPKLNYEAIGKDHFLFDLVYNPENTAFMQAGQANGAQTKNGYLMLVGQAEKAWEIWNS